MLFMRFVAIGRSQFLYNSVEKLINSKHILKAIITDKGTREYTRQIEDFKKLAEKYSVPFLVSSNNSEICDFLSNINDFEIGISVNHRNLINESVINQFNYGILNFHGGDLPKYKGNACQAWAIINGEEKVAACIHKMVANQLDEGPIILKKYLNIDESTKVNDILQWIYKIGPGMFLESINLLSANPQYRVQDNKEFIRSHRCHERRPEDSQIIWSAPAVNIIRLINASGFPYNGAFSTFEQKIIYIIEASRYTLDEDISAIPGQVTRILSDGVIIACGKNETIKISQVSFDGTTCFSPTEIIKSTRKRLT